MEAFVHARGLFLSGVGLAAFALVGGWLGFLALSANHGTFSIGISIMIMVVALGCAVAAWGVLRLRRWSRGLAVALLLVIAATAATLSDAGWPAWIATGASIGCLVPLLMPSGTQALRGARG